jgi:anaerobic magnesium-protoporphyrin IX monomethyl ester cyclase
MGMHKHANAKGPVVIVSKDIVYAFPFGIAYLAGSLRQMGENVLVVFRPEHPRFFSDFVRHIVELKPFVVAFGSIYPDLYPARDMIRLLRQKGCPAHIVIGGQMVSPTPEFSVNITGADYGVIGEGELIFGNLVKALRSGNDPFEVKGLVIRQADKTFLTGPGPFIDDLSELPPIPYDLFPSEKWLDIGRFYATVPQPHWRFSDRVVSIHGGRGCPYTCNFCYHASKARYRKIASMIAEANEMLSRYDANMLYFGDDLVLASPKRARELVEALEALSRPVEYSVSCRFDILSRMEDSLLRDMKRSGCRIMGLGIESGSQRILDIMNKNISVEQIRDGLRRLKKAGILPSVSMMVGQLTETHEDVKASMDLMKETVRDNKYAQFAFTVTTPFPGTDLYNLALQKGMLQDHEDFFRRFNPELEMGKVTVNFSEMADEEIVQHRLRLDVTYNQESRTAKGRFVCRIEKLRRVLGTCESRLRRRLLAGSPATGFGQVILWPFTFLYNLVQVTLDHLRLRLYGLH